MVSPETLNYCLTLKRKSQKTEYYMPGMETGLTEEEDTRDKKDMGGGG